MRTIQIIELGTMQDLINISKHFLFRMEFGEWYVYYSGMTGESFVGLNIYLSPEKYEGFVRIDDRGKIVQRKKQDPGSLVIIPVINDTLVRNVLANYIVSTRGISKKTVKAAAKNLNLLLETMGEKLS
jgi:hypothetical protein